MKTRMLCLLLAFMMLLSLAACDVPEESMILHASDLSEETRRVLDALNDVTAYFDYAVDDQAYELILEIMVCEDGEWRTGGSTTFMIDANSRARIGVRLNDDTCELMHIYEDGYNKGVLDVPVSFDGTGYTAGMATLTREETIVPGEAQTLLARLSMDDGVINSSAIDTWQDTECSAGVVVQATFVER